MKLLKVPSSGGPSTGSLGLGRPNAVVRRVASDKRNHSGVVTWAAGAGVSFPRRVRTWDREDSPPGALPVNPGGGKMRNVHKA
jgi:hypothetical protein